MYSIREPQDSPLVVSTMLTPAERRGIDAAGEGSYRAMHRDSIAELVRDIKGNRASAVVLSVMRCDTATRPSVAALVREFPGVPAVAVVSQLDRTTLDAAVQLGATGLRRVVDIRDAGGWRTLRTELLAARSEDVQREALGRLALDLSATPPECWRFFEALFTAPLHVSSIRLLAARLDVLPSTLMSRFFRARLPAPKRYLAVARLVRAARLFENPGFSIANVSNHLEYSSPQSFGRHVHTLMGISPATFREQYDGEGMISHFRESLILPHVAKLRDFRPLTPSLTSATARRPERVRAARARRAVSRT